LIDAKYPAYENVIQKENQIRWLIEPNFKKYQAYCHLPTKHHTKSFFDKKGNSLTILSEDKDYNNKTVEHLPLLVKAMI
jgi:hypothetical protein